jgi:hypothetical protein
MSADATEPPPPPEIPETRDNGSSQGEDEPGHATREDIDAADASSSGPEGNVADNDASDGPQEPVNGDRETASPGPADADSSDGPEDSGDPADSGSPGHDETRHAAAEDMDAVDDAHHGVHDDNAGSHPLQSEDPLPAPEDDGAATGGDPGVPESQEKGSVDAEATRLESDEDVTGKPAEEPNGSHGETEEPTDRPEPGDVSVEVQGGDDSRPPNPSEGEAPTEEPQDPETSSAEAQAQGPSESTQAPESVSVDEESSHEAPMPAEAPGQEPESSETDVPADEAPSEPPDESDRAETLETLGPEDVSKRIDELDDWKGGEGHMPGRHLDVTDQQLTDRLGTAAIKDGSLQFYPPTNPNYPGHLRLEKQKDPLTGDTTDGVHGGDHRCGPYATRFDSPEDAVRADSYFRERFNETGVPPTQEVPIKDVLGDDAHERFGEIIHDIKDAPKEGSHPQHSLPEDHPAHEKAPEREKATVGGGADHQPPRAHAHTGDGGIPDRLPGDRAEDLGAGSTALHGSPADGHGEGQGRGGHSDRSGGGAGGPSSRSTGVHGDGPTGDHGASPGGHAGPPGDGHTDAPGGGPDHGPGGTDGRLSDPPNDAPRSPGMDGDSGAPSGWERPSESSGPLERGSELEQQARDQIRQLETKHGDIPRILRNLTEHPAGREIASTIASGRFKDSPNFWKVVSGLSISKDTPGYLEQIRLANRLHESGLTDISFEIKQAGHEIKPGVVTGPDTDLDVMARDAAGNVHGWQFKDMTRADSTIKPRKVVDKIFDNLGQLRDSYADVQTFVVDTKVAKSELADQIGRLQKRYEDKNVQFVIRTPDGTIFVPRRNGQFTPEVTQ